MHGLYELCKTLLYIQESIVIDQQWQRIFKKNVANETTTISVVETEDISPEDIGIETITETLVHGLSHSQLIDDLENKVIEITPSEGFSLLSVFQDHHSEEMNFPTLFFRFAHPSDIVQCFSYLKIAQWDLLHKDDDFAMHITNIFFKAMRIIIQQVSSCAWICIRKGELKGKKLCAKDVKTKHNLNKLLQYPIGYRSLKTICISPDYVDNRKKNIFAMIR